MMQPFLFRTIPLLLLIATTLSGCALLGVNYRFVPVPATPYTLAEAMYDDSLGYSIVTATAKNVTIDLHSRSNATLEPTTLESFVVRFEAPDHFFDEVVTRPTAVMVRSSDTNGELLPWVRVPGFHLLHTDLRTIGADGVRAASFSFEFENLRLDGLDSIDVTVRASLRRADTAFVAVRSFRLYKVWDP